MSEPHVLVVCAVRLGREIVLYDDTWYDHILVDHPRMTNRVEAIEQTIVAPGRVTRDRFRPKRECYYRSGILPPSDNRFYVKVVVEFGGPDPDGIDHGVVVTAFPLAKAPFDEARVW